MMCYKICKEKQVECPVTSCRYWIEHSKSLNCTFGAIENAGGPMKLEDVGEVLNLTAARICQIEAKTLKKIKGAKKLNILQ